MKVISSEKLHIKSWCNNPEAGCVEQAKNLANLPFAFKHIALMPDTHQGYGMPIGGVLATTGVIVPNAVGVDIGCGMCVIKTNLTTETLSIDNLKKVMGEIRKLVPVGFNHHKEKCDFTDMPDISKHILPMGGEENILPVVKSQFENARKQLGTLGGGNHFIEIQKDEYGCIYVMIHSGSRNLGKQVADHYNDIAKELNSKWHTSVDAKSDLAFLPYDTKEAKSYHAEMNYCLAFSKANRAKMIEAIKIAFATIIPDTSWGELIDIQHNYAVWENHFGHNVIVHRKGATSARLGQIGIIPGSQGTKSYIVEGLGNKESFMSCSHGAGRRMGRKEASRKLNLKEEIKMMNDKGILHGIRGVGDLDEAASAYKNIDVVMQEQYDLVKIVTELSPMGVIKG